MMLTSEEFEAHVAGVLASLDDRSAGLHGAHQNVENYIRTSEAQIIGLNTEREDLLSQVMNLKAEVTKLTAKKAKGKK